MSSAEITLADIFLKRGEKLDAKQRQGVKTEQQTAALKKALEKETKTVDWPGVVEQIAEQVAVVLRLPIKKILVRAWQKEQVFEQYLDRSRYAPDETILLPLAEHTIHSEHHPRVKVLFNDRVIHTIVFDIALLLELDGFMLAIRDGKLMEVRTGKCKAEGRVNYGALTLLEKKSGEVPLPGTFNCGEEGLDLTRLEEDLCGEPHGSPETAGEAGVVGTPAPERAEGVNIRSV
jgi:hypothetical protein